MEQEQGNGHGGALHIGPAIVSEDEEMTKKKASETEKQRGK